MTYVERDISGKIIGISDKANENCQEMIKADSKELAVAVLQLTGLKLNIDSLASDLEMIRVIEDLIDVLTEKSIISINDLPPAVQLKILTRKSLRNQGSLGIGSSELIKI